MPANLTLGELQAEFVMGFLNSLILFLIGIYFIQLYAKEKKWVESLDHYYRLTALKVSILWLIINIPFKFIILYFFGTSKLFVPLRIAPEILISSLVVSTYYNKKYLEALSFVIGIHIIFFVFEFITISITSVMLFFIGFFYIKWHINLKEWDKPLFYALLINATWFVISGLVGLFSVYLSIDGILIGIGIFFIILVVGFFIFAPDKLPLKTVLMIVFLLIGAVLSIISGLNSLIGQYLFTFFLKTFINTIIGLGILILIYKREWFNSLEIAGLAQISLFISSIFITLGFNVIDILLVEGNDKLDGAKFVFFIMTLSTFGFMVFIASWGDKLQLVKLRRVVIIVSVIPVLLYLMAMFISQQVSFFENFLQNFIISITFSIIAMVVARRIAYTTIPMQELREHHILEKGMPLLKVTNLKVYYPLLKGMLKRQVGAVKAVDGVSFEIKTGETLGLVGESGCGKTTIANTILGLIDKEDGEILFHDEHVPNELTNYLRQKIQMVFQDPDASLNPRLKVTDIIAEPLKNLLGITNKMEIRRHVLRLMDEVSLKREHMDRYPHEFSGGQKQRIIIARALACNPELIVLDEPTSALDVSVQAQILNLLIDLQEQYGYGFLFITHNLSVVNHIASRVAVMYLGKFVEVGETDQIFLNPVHPYTQALLNSHSEIDPFDQEVKYVIDGEVPSPIAPPPGCTFNPRCVSDARTPECEIDLPHKMKIEEGHYIWCVNPPTGIDIIEETDYEQ
jgi:oligopeptide/dipeptide ABC transporter ATP-binding protein